MVHAKKHVFWTLLILALLLGACRGERQGQLKPDTPERIRMGAVNSEPIPISFAELDNDPFALLNKFVRVSGSYRPISAVACTPFKGPRPRWGLVGEGLQMDIVGGHDIVSILPENAELTVDGVWRLYEGPLGCGKEPPDDVRWYLEVQRITRPNPLIINPVVGPADQIGSEAGTPTQSAATPATPGSPTPGAETDLPPDPSGGTLEGTPPSTATATPVPETPTPATNRRATNTPRPSPTPTTAGASAGGNNATAKSTPTPTPTGTPASPTPDDGSGLATSVPNTPEPITPPSGYGGNDDNGGNYP